MIDRFNDIQELPCLSYHSIKLNLTSSKIKDMVNALDVDLLNLTKLLKYDARINSIEATLTSTGIGRLFLSGDKSSVGKTTLCLSFIKSLLKSGLSCVDIAYIKPVTQCEAEQPITRFCRDMGIDHINIGPVVFYQGFTRAFLAGDTDSSSALLGKVVESVRKLEIGKKIVVIDGVGYPSVGSICGLSNADVAKALNCPVILVGKSGVGDAVDSYNLNSAFFELKGVKVLGGIFNKLSTGDSFYNLENCRNAVNSYFFQ